MINTNINSYCCNSIYGSMGVRIMDKTIHHDRERMLYDGNQFSLNPTDETIRSINFFGDLGNGQDI